MSTFTFNEANNLRNEIVNRNNIEFISSFYWVVEIYQKIVNREELPFRHIKMVSSRFSAKTWSMIHLFVLLLIQKNVNVVCNFVRARADDCFKEMDNIESLIRNYTNDNAIPKPNTLKKNMKVGKNKLNLSVLNEQKENVQKNGGKIGLPIEHTADYIITFYEEASQLDKDLVENHYQSVRGNNNTKLLFIYASNPWVKSHWLMREINENLPENEEYQKELLDKGYNARYVERTNTLYFRPRYTLNKHIKPEQIEEIERLKEVNYNKWKIVSLGLSGIQDGAIYQASLQRLNQNVDERTPGNLIGGIDWGDGKSREASPTTAYIAKVSIDYGIHVLKEYEYWNNREEYIDTQEQISRLCDFYIDFYNKFKQPITVYLDNAALGDFFKTFQTVLKHKGYNAGQIEFLPAIKPKNTWERVETLNTLLSLGIFRFQKQVCPGLYNALENCYEIIKTNPTEEMKRQRSHQYTHWIHAIEYMIGPYFKEFQDQFPILMTTKNLSNTLIR